MYFFRIEISDVPGTRTVCKPYTAGSLTKVTAGRNYKNNLNQKLTCLQKIYSQNTLKQRKSIGKN